MIKTIPQNILNLTPYQAGKPIDEVKRELGLKNVIKLASNENPYISKAVCAAIKKNLSRINRYPEGSCFYLKKKLAQKLGVSAQNIIFGNGSDELIDIIIKTFVRQDEEILTSRATFLEYEIIAKTNGRQVKTIPLNNFKYDLGAIKKAITKKTKLIFIANPNNPTGTYVNKNEASSFLKGLPSNIVVIFDEAYKEFIEARDFPQIQKYVLSKNIILLRTFSKAYGMAGLRIGYAIAQKEFIGFMERARPPFNVNSLAQAGAMAALSDSSFASRTSKLISKGKKYLYENFRRLGISYISSEANFILFDVKRDTVDAFKEMLKYGVIVRDMKQYGLNTFIRVTIGKPSENRKFIQVLKKILISNPKPVA